MHRVDSIRNVDDSTGLPAIGADGVALASSSLHARLAETVNILETLSTTIKDFCHGTSAYLDMLSVDSESPITTLGRKLADVSEKLEPCVEWLSILKRQLKEGESIQHQIRAHCDGAIEPENLSPATSAATIDRVDTPTTLTALDDDQENDANSVVPGSQSHALGPLMAPSIHPEPYAPIMLSPGYIHSTAGMQGNFELVVPLPSEGLRHLTRHNDRGGNPWSVVQDFGRCLHRPVGGITMVETVAGQRWDLVCVVDGSLQHFWRQLTSSDSSPPWKGPRCILPVNSVRGAPSMIRANTRDGEGFLVLFIPTASQKGVLHLSTQAIRPAVSGWQPTWRRRLLQWKWDPSSSRPLGVGCFVTAAFEQSSSSECPGSQRGVVAMEGESVRRFEFDPIPPHDEASKLDINSIGPPPVHAPLTGNPVIVDLGIIEFEGGESSKTLLVPTAEGGITQFVTTRHGHWERKKEQIAKELGLISGLAALRSNFGTPGNIEVVCRAGNKTYDFAWVCSTNTWTRPCHLSAAS